MKIRNLDLKVGLFIVIPALILIIFIILKLGYSFAASTIDVYLKLDSLKLIKKGTVIKVKGYDVGRVVEIQPVYEPDLHFLAVMRIQNKVAIYDDCAAVIQNQNVIGDTIIELKNPEKKGNLLRNGDVLEAIEFVSIEALLGDVHSLLATLTETVNVFKGISLESKTNIHKMIESLTMTVGSANRILIDSQSNIVEMMAALRQTAATLKNVSTEFEKHPIKFLTKDK
jgi:ABC-type transporter Mla subunit MlaD